MAVKRIIYKSLKVGLVLLFILAIPSFAYAAFSQLMLSNRVKVRIVDNGNKPVKVQAIRFRSTECEPKPCQGKVLAEVKTTIFGNAKLSTKQLADSFVVEVDGYKTSEEYMKSPGSLLFSRQNDNDFYSVDISQGSLQIKLAPK